MLRNLALLVLSLVSLIACGGSGGGSDPGAQFTIDRQSVSFSGVIGGGNPPIETVTGTVANASGDIYIFVEYTNPSVINDVRVSVSGSRGTMTIYPADPDFLGEGDFTSQIRVSVCNDANCQSQVSGSPKMIAVDYSVGPEPPPPDADGDGVPDSADAFPNDPAESADNDSDGVGDNADTDDDNDGVDDMSDEFPLDGSLSVAATQINITVTGSGAVASSALPADCTNSCTFTTDNTVSPMADFQATAAENFTFSTWGNSSCDDADTSCSLSTAFTDTVDLNVVFTENPHMSVIIDPDDNGSVIEKFGQLQCADYCELKIYGPENQNYELIGLPRPGYDFDGWTNPACGAGENCEFNVVFGTSLSVTATFSPNAGTFDLCPGDPNAVFTGDGEDDIGSTWEILPLCNGHLILTELLLNQIIVRDVVNGLTSHTFQLSAAPQDIVLVEESKLLYVTHGATTHISRIDLRTGLVSELYVESGAQSVTASDDGRLFVKQNSSASLHLYDSENGIREDTQSIVNLNIDFNDATARLIGGINNYLWDAGTGQLTLQGPSAGGGSGSYCNYVVVSPDGEHAAKPCGGGNGPGYSIYDFYSHDPNVVFGEWATGAYPGGAAFAPSNKFVLLTDTRDLQLFDVATHQLVLSTPGDRCNYYDMRKLAVSNDGKLLFGVTNCGFRDETAVVTWYAYDTN